MPVSEQQYRYTKRWRYERAHGQLRLTDAAPVRAHLEKCVGAGMSQRGIAASAGLSVQVVNHILHGQKTCKKSTAEALLQVAPGPTTRAAPDTTEPFVPRVGTERRIQALLALGWTHELLRARCGRRTGLVLHQAGRWVTASMHADIAKLYDELCMTPGPSDLSRRRAMRAGFLPPLAWDDIDLDPEPPALVADQELVDVDELLVDRAVAGELVSDLTDDELLEVVRRLRSKDISDNQIAKRLHRRLAAIRELVTDSPDQSAPASQLRTA